jgi:hypothetical protein
VGWGVGRHTVIHQPNTPAVHSCIRLAGVLWLRLILCFQPYAWALLALGSTKSRYSSINPKIRLWNFVVLTILQGAEIVEVQRFNQLVTVVDRLQEIQPYRMFTGLPPGRLPIKGGVIFQEQFLPGHTCIRSKILLMSSVHAPASTVANAILSVLSSALYPRPQ